MFRARLWSTAVLRCSGFSSASTGDPRTSSPVKRVPQGSPLRGRCASTAGRTVAVIAVIAFIVAIPDLVSAQDAGYPPSGQVRSAAAVAVLQNALAQMGGENAWKQVHGAHVTGEVNYGVTSASGYATTPVSIDWVDDWSTGVPRNVRMTTNSSGQHTHKSDGSPTFTTMFRGKSIRVPRQDKTSFLIDHLPGAALAIELGDHDYRMEVMPSMPMRSRYAIRFAINCNSFVQGYSKLLNNRDVAQQV
jgi:hypothetical protein